VGQILGDRYAIVRQIGQGGFGRTYLAEDVNRFREPCVLKEFSPQIQTPYVLQKAEQLFQREATVLYKLQHPQIPRFRELFRINVGGKEYLFLVQDFVEGKTYSSLLNDRVQQGTRFSESEVQTFLQQVLPVLDYIHSMGVIHRDISPDNLILTPTLPGGVGGLPVLIDFGGVKQVAAVVVSQYYDPDASKPPIPTLLGKVGYAPPEQMQTGMVEAHSDLYALAATAVVLLTGKHPNQLIDTYNLTWRWRQEVSVSPNLGAVLDKMLSSVPVQRYQSAREVLQALNNSPVVIAPTVPVSYPEPTSATVSVAPAAQSQPVPPPPAPVQTSRGKILVISLIIVAVGGTVGYGTYNLIRNRTIADNPSEPTESPSPIPSVTVPTDPQANYSPAEQARKERLRDRRRQLGVDYNFYLNLVNQVFWDRNPSLRGRTLTDSKEDESLRADWDKTAAEVLEKLAPLSTEARSQLGTYTSAQRDRWKIEVNNINVGSRSLYDLGDAPFFAAFPQQRGKNFIEQPVGQVWHGFVSDKLSAILAGSSFKKLEFAPGSTSRTVNANIKPTDGRVYIAKLSQDQLMEVKLQANSKVLLSIYTPSGANPLLEDSTQRTFSTTLPESGFYEFVVVSTASSATDVQLTISAENPTPEPTSEPTPEPTPEPTTPTPEPTSEPTTPTPEPTSTP
jgi:serine/threonine-protein kinase